MLLHSLIDNPLGFQAGRPLSTNPCVVAALPIAAMPLTGRPQSALSSLPAAQAQLPRPPVLACVVATTRSA